MPYRTCSTCNGKGYTGRRFFFWKIPCRRCRGEGRIFHTEPPVPHSVAIPPRSTQAPVAVRKGCRKTLREEEGTPPASPKRRYLLPDDEATLPPGSKAYWEAPSSSTPEPPLRGGGGRSGGGGATGDFDRVETPLTPLEPVPLTIVEAIPTSQSLNTSEPERQSDPGKSESYTSADTGGDSSSSSSSGSDMS